MTNKSSNQQPKADRFDMTKITFSYGLWGTDPKYLKGAVAQAPAIHRFFPHATVLFFVGHEVPEEVVKTLLEQGCRLVFEPSKDVTDRYCWRFLAWQHATWRADYICYRDVDSRIGLREVLSVYYWIASGKACGDTELTWNSRVIYMEPSARGLTKTLNWDTASVSSQNTSGPLPKTTIAACCRGTRATGVSSANELTRMNSPIKLTGRRVSE
jgi:hypothetical protein